MNINDLNWFRVEESFDCPNCGGKMIGDGYTCVYHCENADEELYYDHEPDSNPVYCEIKDEK
mgnify:CR=1 FL=1